MIYTFYSTYHFLSHVIQNGIDIVSVQHGVRAKNTDFNKGEILGKKYRIVTLI